MIDSGNLKVKLGIDTKAMAYIEDGHEQISKGIEIRDKLEKELQEIELKLVE